MERLGLSDAFGRQLLTILSAAGWTVDDRAAFAGDGVLVTVSKNGHEVRAMRDTLAEAALAAFGEATRVQALGLGQPVQLKLT